jgi:hypothetical protein
MLFDRDAQKIIFCDNHDGKPLLFFEALKDEFQNYVMIEHGFTFH